QPAVHAVSIEESKIVTAEDKKLVQKVADKNVQLTVQQIREKSHLLAELADTGEIAIVGGMYDIETGKVQFFDEV
ncbi:MAG: carbonic anhydrase, partial [Methylococcaceae bacterium]|nr:carbonic anhydrase [Methylococcaceae bacterium]MDP3905422.1 carbonic anhydrase [Methylococcaceae bacterium]